MTLRLNCLAILFLALYAPVLMGYPPSHGPFEKREEPLLVRRTQCTAIGSECVNVFTNRLLFGEPGITNGPFVRIDDLGTASVRGGWRITVVDAAGLPVSTPIDNDMVGPPYSVFTADLNRDAKPDFMFTVRSMGQGLGSSISTTTLMLSSGPRYAVTNFNAYDFGPQDIVWSDGPCYIIGSALEGADCKDGFHHNFWIYRLYQVEGDRLVETKGPDSRFPKIIMFTIRENHRETTLLTPAQKKLLLTWSDLFRYE
jgi:hypothetical protein